MAHFLLAWELGANLGHATRLRAIALALKARGHRLSLVLRDVVSTRSVLGPELGPTFQAPLLLKGSSNRTAWSLADILLSCGYDEARQLAGVVDVWKALLDLSDCDAVIADHAPTALLAARVTGIPALHVGHGFSLPPRVTPMPVFRDWAAVHESHAAVSDAKALRNVNEVLAAYGEPLLPQLCDLFYPEQTMLCAWPELDHYAGLGRSPHDYLGPDSEFMPGEAPSWPTAAGPRVLAYLRSSYPENADVLRALDAMGCSTVCFFPEHPATMPESVRIRYSAQPIDLQKALPECALMICHAGQATTAQAMRFGVPCLMLPTQTEQFLLARQLERTGAGINAAALARPVDYVALIGEMLRPGASHVAAARALAQKYAGFDPTRLTARIAATAELLISRSART